MKKKRLKYRDRETGEFEKTINLQHITYYIVCSSQYLLYSPPDRTLNCTVIRININDNAVDVLYDQDITNPLDGNTVLDQAISDKYIAIMNEKGKLYVFKNDKKASLIHTLTGTSQILYASRLKIVNDRIYILNFYTDNAINVFDLNSGELLFSLPDEDITSYTEFEADANQFIVQKRISIKGEDKTKAIYHIYDFCPQIPSISFMDKLTAPFKETTPLFNKAAAAITPAVNNTINAFKDRFKWFMG